MNLYAIRRRDFWGTPEELQKTAARSAEVGEEMADDVRWIRSYVVQEESGKLGTVCIYEGTSAEKVREQVRAWLVDLLAAEGAAIELSEPADWSSWDAERRRQT